jgi:mercuric ion transport protein
MHKYYKMLILRGSRFPMLKLKAFWKTGLWGSVTTALCCLTPLLVFLLGGVGLAFLTPYLDYFLVPLFAIFLFLGFYGWMRGGRIISRRK